MAQTELISGPKKNVPIRWIPTDWIAPAKVEDIFPRSERPVEVDVGCGKGRFLLARARHHPNVNFLGIERLLGRLRKVERKVSRAQLDNVRLLRCEASYAVRYLLPTAAITTYYIFFPDPWPKARHHDHRLFSADFLSALARTLVSGGQVHLATDHEPYFLEIQDLLRLDHRFESVPPFEPIEEERTDFELAFLGRRTIFRASFRKI